MFENTPGLVSSGQIDEVERRVVEAGYHMVWFLVNAFSTGLPQLRERVFMVGWRAKFRPQAFKLEFDNAIEGLIQVPNASERWLA